MKNRTAGIAVVVVSLLSLVLMGVMWAWFGWMPEGKSTHTDLVDAPFYFVLYASAILTVGVVLVMLRFIIIYRRKEVDQQSIPVSPSRLVETLWVVLPTILVMFIFTWGFKAFMTLTQAPADAYEIRVVARKWAWEFEYPNGYISTNELIVPSGRAVKLLMTADDVLHSFFVPAFRVKHDVVPNRYTTVWFEATSETGLPSESGEGYIRIYCTEYCGRGHSAMLAKLWVVGQDVYNEWLASAGSAGDDMPLPELGKLVFNQKACNGCHSIDGAAGVGPSMQGLFGKTESLSDGTTVEVDENYLRESILVPAATIVEGFQPIMPPIPLQDREVDALIEYIKELR